MAHRDESMLPSFAARRDSMLPSVQSAYIIVQCAEEDFFYVFDASDCLHGVPLVGLPLSNAKA